MTLPTLRFPLLSGAVVLGLCGCQTELQHVEDRGRACVEPDPSLWGAPEPVYVEVKVTLDECLPCEHEELESSCAASYDAATDMVTIEAWADIELDANKGPLDQLFCDGCQVVDAECEWPSIPNHEPRFLTIAYGEESDRVLFPFEDDTDLPFCVSSW